MNRTFFRYVFIFLGIGFGATVSAAVGLGERQDGHNKPGADPQANTGSTITDPMTTEGPTGERVQPNDTGKGITAGRGVPEEEATPPALRGKSVARAHRIQPSGKITPSPSPALREPIKNNPR